MTSTHCHRGHLRTAKNTRWFTRNGRRYPMCRMCESTRYRQKYWTDTLYRQRSRAKVNAWYHANRSLAARQAQLSCH